MDERAVVEAMARAWREWQREPEFPFKHNHCINGARIVIEALRQFDIAAWPVSVQFILFNRPAWDLWAEGIPFPAWPEHAWSLGVGPGGKKEGGDWDGHLVVCTEGFTIDISAAQFNRPGRITVDGPKLLPPLEDDWMQLSDDHDQILVIKPWPENNGWRIASGWKRLQGEEVREIVARTRRAMEERNPDGEEP
jgi:hypothetical protein